VTNIPGEPLYCWITSNLGADHQATSVSDATEASAGWYWQFNRKQGYKHDGTTRTPNTTWTSSISEDSGWTTGNDPCLLELSDGWRLPAYSELSNVASAGNWTNWSQPWSSGLKLHAAGALDYSDGSLVYRGQYGLYWTSTQHDDMYAFGMIFLNMFCNVSYGAKVYAQSLRCLRDNCSSAPDAPTTGTHVSSQTQITWNWNSSAGATGYKWNTVDEYNTATNLGPATSTTEEGLACNTGFTRYVWAYNGCGYSSPVSLTQSTNICWNCGDPLTIHHELKETDGVAPVDKTVTYGTVVADIPDQGSKCFLTSNLGADHQATAVNDDTEASAGWYWQFNRKQGYKHDGTSRTPESDWINPIEEDSYWEASNDPCTLELGSDWRIPSQTEWGMLDEGNNWATWNGPWNSVLKLHAAGMLDYNDGLLVDRGTTGYYWSNAPYSVSDGRCLVFNNSDSYMSDNPKAGGFSIRCLKNN
jgi:hypothetical protein